MLLRKAPEWSYEEEWRLFDTVGLNDSPLAMTDITFGLRCPATIIYSVVSALENREDGIEFYHIRQVRGSYALKRVELDLNDYAAYFPKTARSGIEIFGPFDE